jgi:probable HAF family extracellular repeat protein
MTSRFAIYLPSSALAYFLIAAMPVSVRSANFIGLGELPGGDFLSQSEGISADGSVVVGYSYSTTGQEGYRWTSANGMVGLGNLYGAVENSSPQAISADGSTIVGGSNGIGGFRWTNSEGYVGLVGLGTAYDVSADGSIIVGEGNTVQGSYPCRWTRERGLEFLNAVHGAAFGTSANGNVVVGYATFSDSRFQAFRWESGGRMVALGFLPDGTFSFAEGVSDDGSTIVGYAASSGGRVEAFRWTSDTGMVGLGHIPGGMSSYARAVSADGSLIVGDDSSGAFIWDASHGMRNLRDVLSPGVGGALNGWTLTYASAISADGRTIVGGGINPSGKNEAWVAYLGRAVPEPASSMLVGLGLIVALAASRARHTYRL